MAERKAKKTVQLTQDRVDELVAAGIPGRYWDTKVQGFVLRVARGGTGTYYVLKRVRGRGDVREHKIARTADMPLREARSVAQGLVADMAKGVDPADALRALRAARTLSQVKEDHFARGATEWKPRTCEENERMWKLHLEPAFGHRVLRSITAKEIEAWHVRMSKAAPSGANRRLALLKAIFNTAVRLKEIAPQDNPASVVSKTREERREARLNVEQRKALEAALRVEEENGNRYAAALIRLLAYTGARRDELRTLRWDYVDLERRVLLLPDSKTGRRSVFLPQAAIDLLKTLPRVRGNPCVFPGRASKHGKAGPQPINNVQSPWERVRKAAGLGDMRLHDLRHAFATSVIEAGGGIEIVKELLGHSDIRTTQRYLNVDKGVVALAALERVEAQLAPPPAESEQAPPTPSSARAG